MELPQICIFLKNEILGLKPTDVDNLVCSLKVNFYCPPLQIKYNNMRFL